VNGKRYGIECVKTPGKEVFMQAIHSNAPMGALHGPGKSAQSVGHQAKAAVAAAKESGAMLPSNAQGLAASGIARGADPATIFAAMVTPEPPPPDPDVAGEGDIVGVPVDDGSGGADIGTDMDMVTDAVVPATGPVGGGAEGADDTTLIQAAAAGYAEAGAAMTDGEAALALMQAA
jgi:hypothetical protein